MTAKVCALTVVCVVVDVVENMQDGEKILASELVIAAGMMFAPCGGIRWVWQNS